MRSNGINAIGLKALGIALETNNSLEMLSLFGNDFSCDVGKQYQDLIGTRLNIIGVRVDIQIYFVDGVYEVAEKAIEE